MRVRVLPPGPAASGPVSARQPTRRINDQTHGVLDTRPPLCSPDVKYASTADVIYANTYRQSGLVLLARAAVPLPVPPLPPMPRALQAAPRSGQSGRDHAQDLLCACAHPHLAEMQVQRRAQRHHLARQLTVQPLTRTAAQRAVVPHLQEHQVLQCQLRLQGRHGVTQEAASRLPALALRAAPTMQHAALRRAVAPPLLAANTCEGTGVCARHEAPIALAWVCLYIARSAPTGRRVVRASQRQHQAAGAVARLTRWQCWPVLVSTRQQQRALRRR